MERRTIVDVQIKTKNNLDHSDASDLEVDEGKETPNRDRVVDDPNIGEIRTSNYDKN